jgi:hypothetical protein
MSVLTLPEIPYMHPKTNIRGTTTLPYDDPINHYASLEKYFNPNKLVKEAGDNNPQIIPLNKIYSDKLRPDGVLRGAYYMRRSYELDKLFYETSKDNRRAPILVDEFIKDNYIILDGHSTYENAKKANWPMIYVVQAKHLDEYVAPKIGGYYKYKSRRYKRNKQHTKKNHTKKNYTKKNYRQKYR